MTAADRNIAPVAEDPVVDGVVAVLGSFLRASDALCRAVDSHDAVAMCDALVHLGVARKQALALVGR